MDKMNILEAGIILLSLAALSGMASAQGFNGYNLKANVFVGTYTQWCVQSGYGTNASCASEFGSTGNDIVVMKWNAQWNNCNNNGYTNPTYCAGAWVDNEINGKVPGGDNTVWHYKIIWVGPEGASSSYWLPGGYSIWGNYEVIMDQGINGTVHTINAIATPDGYGA